MSQYDCLSKNSSFFSIANFIVSVSKSHFNVPYFDQQSLLINMRNRMHPIFVHIHRQHIVFKNLVAEASCILSKWMIEVNSKTQ